MIKPPEYEDNHVTIGQPEYACPFCSGVEWHDIGDDGNVLRRWSGLTWIERICRPGPRVRIFLVAECAACGATASGYSKEQP
jgi:hypothetical protein